MTFDNELVTDGSEEREALHRKNMEMFRNYSRDIYLKLVNWKPISQVVFTDTGEPDIEYTGTRLYGEVGAFTYADRQVEKFLADPVRLAQTGGAKITGLDPHAMKFNESLIDEVESEGLEIGELLRGTKEYFLVVFGVGLGGFIDRLVESVDPQVLIITEPNVDFFYHSTFFFDWTQLVERFTVDGRRITILLTSDVRSMSNAIIGAVRCYNPSALDGLTIFEHYPNAHVQQAVENTVKEELRIGMMGLGYFEDELHMLSNAYGNLSTGRVRMIGPITTPRPPLPVFICGSGPSIDNDLDFLRANQDRAVVISCGSNIDILLRNGIRPDFHVLLERDPALLRFMQATARDYGLEGICIVGAANLYPGVIDLYENAVSFFRPGLSPPGVFSTHPDQVLGRVDPLVVNGGLAVAMRVGFEEIYLFGADVGARAAGSHHSKHSWYSTKGMAFPSAFRNTVPGNFGGTVYCDDLMSWSRTALEGLIKESGGGRRIFNCSDGGLIVGATPRLSEMITLPAVGDKRAHVAELLDIFPLYSKDQFDQVWAEQDYLNAIRRKVEGIIAVMEEYDLDDHRYMTKTMELLKPPEINDGPATMVRGTVYQLIMVVHMVSRRLVRDEDMPRFQAIARRHYRKMLEDMLDEALTSMRKTMDGTLDLSDYMDYCLRINLGLGADEAIPEL